MWIDYLSDAWRWWAAPGALIGLILLIPRLYGLGIAIKNEESATHTIMPERQRFLALCCGALFMVACLIAGTIIPLTSYDRVLGVTQETYWFRVGMAMAWCTWSSACWGMAISLAPRWKFMMASAIVMWWAMFVAVIETVGLGL